MSELATAKRIVVKVGSALLVGPDQKWLTTIGYLEKVDEYLNKALVG